MKEFFEQWAIMTASAAIRTFVKNPQSALKYRAVLQHISDDLALILATFPPDVPPTQ